MRCVLLAAVLAFAACHDRQVEQLEAVKAAVCTCKDVACGETALATLPHDDIESTHRTQQLARAMLDCLAKLYDAERPTTDPDAPATGDDGSATGDPAPAPIAGSAAPAGSGAPSAATTGRGTPAGASARRP